MMQDMRTAPPSVEGYLTTADGIRLYFRKTGSGPRLVVVPNGLYLVDEFKRLTDRRTIVFYDVRNRGKSDTVDDAARLEKGIQNDVDDLDAVRRHFDAAEIDLIGHSYIGLMVVLYAIEHSAHVGRVVQIGAMQPDMAKKYPPDLTHDDGTLARVFARLAEMRKEQPSPDPAEMCERFWSILREIYVVDPADADRIRWGRCELQNERNFMKYWTEQIQPSIQSLRLSPEDFARATMPVLTVHGKCDRSAPYGGGRDWAAMLPNARLVTVEQAGHAPWIEAPDTVFDAMTTFLDGSWPATAEKVDSLGA